MVKDKTYSLVQLELNKWIVKVNYKANLKIRTTTFEMSYGEMIKLTDVLSWSGFLDVTKGNY